MPGVGELGADQVREALRLLGGTASGNRAAGQRELARVLRGYGTVRTSLEAAPPGARSAFVRLAQDGPATVQDLLGRGWWGHGTLPPPLDWLQRRAFVHPAPDGLVHAVAEARDGFSDLTLALEPAAPEAAAGAALALEPAGCVVVAPEAGMLDRALTAPGAQLRAVAPTVAVSAKSPGVVAAALRSAGVRLLDDAAVTVRPGAPALPGTAEDAVGPRAVRALLARAVGEARQVQLEYYASSRGGAATERVVDPWAFDDNLLRGYCHLRNDERTFAVDRIGRARLLPSGIEVSPP